VLDEGRIVEEGNHLTLMKKKGLYAELFDIQAQGYK
jgi:ABC-type multidrug transport system fused ATPase/permease subunit